MVNLKFEDTYNMVAFLSKPEESDGTEQIVDFLNAHPTKYALTVNPTIYTSCIEQFWSTVKAKTINGEVQLHALVDGKKIIVTESTVRRDLQLEDAEGIDCLPNSTIFEELTRMSSKTTAWNEFSSTMTSAIICLATNQKFNFSKYIFESMVRNLDNLSGKFLMYPSGPIDIVADEVVHKELGDRLVRAPTTASSLEAKQDSGGGPGAKKSWGILLLKLVLDLEKTKTTQQIEINSVKRRVKKVEKKRSSRSHKLKRLYKVGLTTRVESSRDEEDLGEDASKQGKRINAIDADEDITLVNVQDDADNEMFDVHALNDEEFLIEEVLKVTSLTFDEEERLAREKAANEKEANVAWTEEWDDIQADHELAQRLQAEEQEELSIKEKTKLIQELLEKRRKHFTTKSIEEKRNKPPTQAQQRKIMCTYLKNMEGKKLKDLKNKSFYSIQKMFDKSFKRVNTFVDIRTDLVEGSSKRAGEELEQESTKK
ncbi:hypothetical protein Tco_1132754 [Tanacetum coccineum]|uniref:Xylulose kinase-1 n=1 Tax=Tanacetum coccineum TaxID=301880 RepID=A0ABQ5JCZ0_9ASTR